MFVRLYWLYGCIGCIGCMGVCLQPVELYVCNLWSCMFACLYGCMLACLLFYAFPCCFLLIIRRRFARWLSHICHWLCSCLFACVLTLVPLVISRKCHF